MAYIRQVPHRPKRENKELNNKEMQQYRSENQKLRRENARLRRQINKLSTDELTESTEEVETLAAVESANIVKSDACPYCGFDNFLEFPTPTKIILVCRECKWRKAS